MPHNIIHDDACFAYFNKIRGIPAMSPTSVETAPMKAEAPSFSGSRKAWNAGSGD